MNADDIEEMDGRESVTVPHSSLRHVIHSFVIYDRKEKRSECCVIINVETKAQSGDFIKGKNPTNLVKHV